VPLSTLTADVTRLSPSLMRPDSRSYLLWSHRHTGWTVYRHDRREWGDQSRDYPFVSCAEWVIRSLRVPQNSGKSCLLRQYRLPLPTWVNIGIYCVE
jgi:hypothetical protein